MQVVERHIVQYDYRLDNICWISKNLYNYVLYLIKEHYIATGKILDEYELYGKLASEDQLDYRCLPAQTSQQVINLVFKAYKSFFKAFKDFGKNPGKYKSCPRSPNFKKPNGQNVVIFTKQNCHIEDGFVIFPKMTNLQPLRTNIVDFRQVRIIPEATCFVIEIVYEREIKRDENLDANLYLSIDLGIDNFAGMVDNNGKSLIVNGKVLKSINQYYNKKKSFLQSFVEYGSRRIDHLVFRRNNKVEDFLHKSSRFIVNYCLENHIKNIIVGYNEGWKQETNMGKINNQKFCNIPFREFIHKLEYKSELVGINVVTKNESHTSKCDAFALEKICHHEKYLGRRVKRGLFRSSTGKFVNADIQGALNTMRNVIGDGFMRNLINKSDVLSPVRVEILAKNIKICV